MNRKTILVIRHRPVQSGSGYKGTLFQEGYGEPQGFRGVLFQKGYGRSQGFRGALCQKRYGFRRNIKFRVQRGRGWGALGRLFARLSPAVFRGVKRVGKQMLSNLGDQAVNTGMNLLNDVAAGENVLESAKLRLKEGGNELMNTTKDHLLNEGQELVKTVKRKLSDIKQRGSGKKFKGSKNKSSGKKHSSKKPISRSGVNRVTPSSKCIDLCSKLPYRTIFDKFK